MRKWSQLICNMRHVPGRFIFWWIAIALASLTGAGGCVVKRNVRVVVPAQVLNAKSASLAELVALINNYSARFQALSSTTMRVTFISGRADHGLIQEYRSAPGYILLRRPDQLLMNIQNPLTKTTILELLSTGDDFSLWLPSRNQFVTGKNTGGELVLPEEAGQLEFSARPIHILRAILPPPIPGEESGIWLARDEEQDENAKFYVLSVFRKGTGRELILERKVWVERSELKIVRDQTYEAARGISGTVGYASFSPQDGVQIPLSIQINRPLDGYSLKLEFKDWRINSEMPADVFVKHPPTGAQVVALKEKQQDERRQK